jgi:hypothetical protein
MEKSFPAVAKRRRDSLLKTVIDSVMASVYHRSTVDHPSAVSTLGLKARQASVPCIIRITDDAEMPLPMLPRPPPSAVGLRRASTSAALGVNNNNNNNGRTMLQAPFNGNTEIAQARKRSKASRVNKMP